LHVVHGEQNELTEPTHPDFKYLPVIQVIHGVQTEFVVPEQPLDLNCPCGHIRHG